MRNLLSNGIEDEERVKGILISCCHENRLFEFCLVHYTKTTMCCINQQWVIL